MFDALPSQKTLSGWQVELCLDKVAPLVLGVNSYNQKISRV